MPEAKFNLVCTSCDWEGEAAPISECARCGGVLDIRYTSPEIPVNPDLPGIWRYAAHLPLDDLTHAVSLGEGQTPLLQANRLSKSTGLDNLYFKQEGMNPTGSYKDRIAAVGMAHLVAQGKSAWAATSSGNGGAAMAAYGVRAGVPGYLFTLEKASRAKIAQIITYGPAVYAVNRLGYDPDVEIETWDNIRTICEANNWLMLVTARKFSPFAMEGVKTLAYEICEQFGNHAPDVVYLPVGGGGLCSTTWKGFKEWHAAGYIDKLPKIVSVQGEGCDAIRQAWEAGLDDVPTIPDCTSTISGLQLTAPPDGKLVLESLRESGGWHTTVPDADTYAAQEQLAANEGMFVEPAAAITLAAVHADLASGRLHGDETVVCVLTGVGFKDANAVQAIAEKKEIHTIDAGQILELKQ